MVETTKPFTADAVIVIPGVMGSELVEVATGSVLWGLADPGWYVHAWTSPGGLARLAVTDEERAGRATRIRPTRLLTTPAAVPVFHGMEPYRRLTAAVRQVVAHPDAVLEFPYDWRLSTAHNARLLDQAAQRHLDRWRVHPFWRESRRDGRMARLTMVAHSMGGLVARESIASLGGVAAVRLLITLGTPFYGAVKTLHILGNGGVHSLPQRRLRTLARTLPGLYDLLPTYRCVLANGDLRRLAPGDVAGIGGDAALAGPVLRADRPTRSLAGTELRTFIGVDQPTMQTATFADGQVTTLSYSLEVDEHGTRHVDYGGDSTVFRRSASLEGTAPSYVPQSHGALAKTDEAIAFVRTLLTEGPLTPPLPGEVSLSVDVPDVVAVGDEFAVRVPTLTDPSAASCQVTEVGPNLPLLRPRWRVRDGCLVALTTLPRPGIYRIDVKGGGYSAVSQLILAVPPADLEDPRL